MEDSALRYGGLFSNVFDLDKFLTALFIEKTLISQASLDIMATGELEGENAYTGVGAQIKFPHKSSSGIGHNGRDLGYSADLYYFPATGEKMIFFVNYGTDAKSELKQVFVDFENALVDALLE